MKRAYSYQCECETEFTFHTGAPAGYRVGFSCPACARAFAGTLPGETTKKRRAKTEALHNAILAIFIEMQPRLSVRQVFYQLEVRGYVEKSQRGYRQAQYQMKQMRERGILPYGWIADNTRWQIKPTTFRGLREALQRTQETYRRDLWAQANAHLEIWVEKAALAGVIAPITREYDVGLFVARGFSSDTFIFDTAQEIIETGKPAFIYHLGDWDYYGVNAAHKIAEGLRKHGARVQFERAAITPEQIAAYNLPTREAHDERSRKKGWRDCVELDALPPNVLRALVRDCIEKHVDQYALAEIRRTEDAERETLEKVLENFVPVPKPPTSGAQPLAA